METRSSVIPTLPCPNPTISYWQDLDPVSEISSLRSTSLLPEYVETVVIGSGLSGASIAYNLLSRPTSSSTSNTSQNPPVLMLEARTACSGATGRNGGHTKAASYRSFISNVKSLGRDEAIKIARFEYANIKAEHQFIKGHDIKADLYSGDTVDIIYDQSQWEKALEAIKLMKEMMSDVEDAEGVSRYEVYSAEEAREIFYVDGERDDLMGAIKYFAGSLSAYKFVMGIIELCLDKGLNLQANTPALSINRNADGVWSIDTERGTVRTRAVVLATNGYTAHLLPSLVGTLVPLRGQVQAHRPGAAMPKDGLPTTYSFIYKNGYEYMIPRLIGFKFAGDIIMGGGLVHAVNELSEYGITDDASLNEDISMYLRSTTPRYFGRNWGEDDSDNRVRKEWSGIMGYTPDGFPLVGEVEDGLWICAGFNGHGMALCFNSAKTLVDMMEAKVKKVKWLDEEFPVAFRWSEERLKGGFRGRLHTSAGEEVRPVIR